METLRLNILVCGAIHSSRKNFPALQDDKTLKRGLFDYRSTADQIAVYKWKDSKAVNLLSNYHGIDSAKVDRKEKDRRKIKVPCPKVVRDYNAHMGGVDMHDMQRQIYGTHRKNIKWWAARYGDCELFFGVSRGRRFSDITKGIQEAPRPQQEVFSPIQTKQLVLQ